MLEVAHSRNLPRREATPMEQLRMLQGIWQDKFPTKAPRSHSLIEKLFVTPILLLSALSLGNVKQKIGVFGHHFMDLYVITWFVGMSTLLIVGVQEQPLVALVAIYRLVDIVTYRLYFLFIK